MSTISFDPGFLDALLRGAKQQTTRRQTDRIKVDDTAQIYIEQRRPIPDKPIRQMTDAGLIAMAEPVRKIPCPSGPLKRYGVMPSFYAHFLGKVQITEVYDILPLQCTCGEEVWAKRDGFAGYADASAWFESKYGEGWVDKWWTVIRWDGWAERYFDPKP